jgi:FkbM family methyltransferase
VSESEQLVSFAQNLEDVVLWRALRTVRDGFYVDVGAADPVKDSVTKLFYDRGWRGIDIDPAPDLAERLRIERNRDVVVQVAVGNEEGSLSFVQVPGTGLSTGSQEAAKAIASSRTDGVTIEVKLTKLDSILSTHLGVGTEIHFLKIDVEGLEREVLLGLDFSIWRPWIVVVEATRPNTTERTDYLWNGILFDAGYEMVLFDGLNVFFVAQEHSELRSLLSYPVCVFDQPFVTHQHHEALVLFEFAEARLKDAEDRLKDAETRLKDAENQRRQLFDSYEKIENLYETTIGDYQRLEGLYVKAIGDYERTVAELGESVNALNDLLDESRNLSLEIINKDEQIENLKLLIKPRIVRTALFLAKQRTWASRLLRKTRSN